jgi:hypothetical protein
VLTLLEGIEGLGGHAQDRVYLKCSMKLQGGGPLLDQELSLAWSRGGPFSVGQPMRLGKQQVLPTQLIGT